MEEVKRLELDSLWRKVGDIQNDVRDVRGELRGKANREELSPVYAEISKVDAASAERHRSITSSVEDVESAVDALQTALRGLSAVLEQDASPAKAPRRGFSLQRLDWRLVAAAFFATGAAGGKTAEIILPPIVGYLTGAGQ